jgi:hypothetical protein
MAVNQFLFITRSESGQIPSCEAGHPARGAECQKKQFQLEPHHIKRTIPAFPRPRWIRRAKADSWMTG